MYCKKRKNSFLVAIRYAFIIFADILKTTMNYFRFLLKSTNQHGVHSPFVFNYLTKGIYQRKKYLNKRLGKTDLFLLKTLDYFQPSSICFLENTDAVKKLVRDSDFNRAIDKQQHLYDLVVADAKSVTPEKLESFLCFFHNDSIGIIDKRNKDFCSTSLDTLLENHIGITLVLNFYWFSLICIRKEQLKENFFLRM